MKSVQGEYYLNGHWTIGAAHALPVASTVLHYERGAEGDLAPERLHARGPTSEPLVIEVSRAGGRDLWGEGDTRSPGDRSGRAVARGEGELLATGLTEDSPRSSSARSPTPACAMSTTCPWAPPGPASAGATARGVTAALSVVEVRALARGGAVLSGGTPAL